MTKVCKTCSIPKSSNEFWVSRKGRTVDGLMGSCKECSKAKRRTWAEKNRKREHEWNQIKYQDDPEYFKNKRHEYRARLNQAYVERVDSLIVLERHDGVCGICEKDVDPLDFHVDHIVPLARGGNHSYANTQPAHPYCNLAKGAKIS